jgi:hypothetical protein
MVASPLPRVLQQRYGKRAGLNQEFGIVLRQRRLEQQNESRRRLVPRAGAETRDGSQELDDSRVAGPVPGRRSRRKIRQD